MNPVKKRVVVDYTEPPKVYDPVTPELHRPTLIVAAVLMLASVGLIAFLWVYLTFGVGGAWRWP